MDLATAVESQVDHRSAVETGARAAEVPRVGELAAAAVAPRPRSPRKGRAGCARATSITSVTAPNRFTRSVDLSRPKSVKSTGEKEYMMIVRDDVSRFTRVFFLRTKDETAMCFSKYLAEISPCKVDVVKSDGGGELSKGAFGASAQQ